MEVGAGFASCRDGGQVAQASERLAIEGLLDELTPCAPRTISDTVVEQVIAKNSHEKLRIHALEQPSDGEEQWLVAKRRAHLARLRPAANRW